MNILLTGATGFIGKALDQYISGLHEFKIRRSCRSSNIPLGFIGGEMTPNYDWKIALSDIDVVIHLAARAHILAHEGEGALEIYRQINFVSTLNLARQASKVGVKRFIYISSIKVNGECTKFGRPFYADSIPAPCDPYAISKYEAEIGLRALSLETGMEIVIIRPPLVYGPGVKANFLNLMRWFQSGVPLPFGGILSNQRSLVFIGNLIDLIVTCINHSAAANQTFLVSDDNDLSTGVLLRRMALALDSSTKLLSVPETLITTAAKLIGRPDISRRLLGSLQVDITKTKNLLGWSPPVSMDEGLRKTAVHFLKLHS